MAISKNLSYTRDMHQSSHDHPREMSKRGEPHLRQRAGQQEPTTERILATYGQLPQSIFLEGDQVTNHPLTQSRKKA